MKKLLVPSLLAAGLMAAGIAQAQTATQTVTVTPAYTYTTVTTFPVAVGNGVDIPAGADYPYPGAAPAAAAPALITTPVVSEHYHMQPVVTFVTPAPGTVASVAVETRTLGAAGTSDVPLQAGEASTMTAGVPNVVTTNHGELHVMPGAPVVIYQY